MNSTFSPMLNRTMTSIARSGLVIMWAILFASFVAQAQTPSLPLTLRRIEFVGLKRLTGQQAIDQSGLRVGDVVTPEGIDAAAQKLMDSGLFKKLSYRLNTLKGDATVTFQVEEAIRNVPVVFENFPWFSDEEIAKAIRQDIPFFDGTAPEAGTIDDKISAALTRLLASRKISAEVESMPYVNLETGQQELLFSVKGIKTPVCSLHFSGTEAIPEADLIKASQPLLNTDYSRKHISGFVQTALSPLYRHIGHLRAEFRQPTAIVDPSSPCNGGADVTIPVDEGITYLWGETEWTGNQALQSDELSTALNMKANEIADGLKIDAGLKALRKTYGRRGYIAVKIKPSATFDDAARRVSYRFAIDEGARYFMGTLFVNGLADDDAALLKSKWTLGNNAVFDEGYLETFRQTGLRDFLRAMIQKRGSAFRGDHEIELKPNPQNQMVDVVITFKP